MRRFLVVFFALFAPIIAAAAPPSTWAQQASPVASPGAGIVESSVAVGGRSLHLACTASGSPTVLFEEGGPDPLGGASLVPQVGPDVAAALGVRFCAYDRAGTGKSTADPAGTRTLKDAAADQRAVLASPDLDCPCVVVAESLGGAIALIGLAANPAGFAGLVLLDAIYPGYLDDFVGLAPSGSPEAALASAPYLTGKNEEHLDLATGFRQVVAPDRPPGIPAIVVSHGAGNPPPCQDKACSAGYPVGKLEADWQAGEADLARALGARLVVAEGTGHSIANDNPTLVIGLTAEVIAAVRDPRTWATPAPAADASADR